LIAAKSARVSDRLLGSPASAAPDAADFLRDAVASRGLPVPKDLVTGIAAGATTLWKINVAQTLVVSNTSREAAIDDAFECGRIAAAAALSAVHATAAQPLFARLTCACPPGASEAARRALIEGVAVAMSDASAVLADAQFVEAAELRFDVLVAGIVRPDRIKRAAGAQAGDALVLASPLGTGIYAAAHTKGRLADDDRLALIGEATRTNSVGIAFGTIRNVHAVVEVGPQGLIAAVLALGAASALSGVIESSQVPALPRALALAKSGCVAPESSRNWNRDGARVELADAVMPEMRALLTDPQVSGALLVACKPESVGRVLELCAAGGNRPAVVGWLADRASDSKGGSKPVAIRG
jgi:selenide,water dikinase